jgi:hypothetical protein
MEVWVYFLKVLVGQKSTEVIGFEPMVEDGFHPRRVMRESSSARAIGATQSNGPIQKHHEAEIQIELQ